VKLGGPIVDIYMPEMDGRELISAMRAQRPDLPIIAISPALLRDSGQIALNIVPADVIRLRNPFRPFELIKAIQSAMTPAALQTPAPAAILWVCSSGKTKTEGV
jgi:CheY-like chemotaxis protein